MTPFRRSTRIIDICKPNEAVSRLSHTNRAPSVKNRIPAPIHRAQNQSATVIKLPLEHSIESTKTILTPSLSTSHQKARILRPYRPFLIEICGATGSLERQRGAKYTEQHHSFGLTKKNQHCPLLLRYKTKLKLLDNVCPSMKPPV